MAPQARNVYHAADGAVHPTLGPGVIGCGPRGRMAPRPDLHFGLILALTIRGLAVTSYEEMRRVAALAETLDLASVWLCDHFLTLAPDAYVEDAGIPFPRIGERIAQLGEGLEIIRRMWTEPHPVFQGRHYAIDGAVCDPPPLQRPHPPIWIGGEGDRIHRLAARAADGVNVRWWGPERIAGRAAYLDAACREAGRDPRALERSVAALLIVDRDAGRAAATRERFAG